ncbi:hypothetical protein D910_12650 [Dendroctonus ponderosae]
MHYWSEQNPHCMRQVEQQNRWSLNLGGCPAHYNRNIRQYLDEKFSIRVIRRESLFLWQPRSPDLTCLDFYLWGRLKDLLFQDKPTTRENMMGRI